MAQVGKRGLGRDQTEQAGRPLSGLASISSELAAAALPDRRLQKRLEVITEGLVKDPSVSFPKAAGSVAALEATYRFLNNDTVKPEVILAAHQDATRQRIAQCAEVIVAHDTTSFEFSGESPREGLGFLRSAGQGFFSHVALALEAGGSRRPLGVLGHEVLVRTGEAKGKRSHKKRLEDPENESKRWLRSIEGAEGLAGANTSLIHVMDREADAYSLMAALMENKRRFVIRATHDRVVSNPEQPKGKSIKVSDAVSKAVVVATREVPLTKRSANSAPYTRKLHPPRQYRVARLAFRATTVELSRPSPLPPSLPKSLSVHVVRVDEIDIAEGQTPVTWTLYTTEPIDIAEDILRVVDTYRARWTIEEYFKALKQGCAFETRQLDSLKSLLVALAIFMPIAWRLLLVRNTAREAGDQPATEVLTETQVEVLVATSKGKLPEHPTVRQAMLAIAARGGHLKSNGEPGWQVLGRGFHDLLLLEIGWIAAREVLATRTQRRPAQPRCDPS